MQSEVNYKHCCSDYIDLYTKHDGILIFKEEHLQSDSWRQDRSLNATILNYFQEYLQAYPEHDKGCPAIFEQKHDAVHRTEFTMKMYRNTNPSGGLSVAFTVKFGVDTYIMYCTKEMEIGFRKGDFPNKINGNHSDIIFYQKDASEGHKTFTFESAQQTKGYFLASLEKDGKHKLGLKRPVDTPDETTFIGLNILNKK